MRRVVITGFGAVTPLGLDAESTWASARDGISGIGWIESFDASEFPVRIAAEVKGFDPETVAPVKEVRRMDRNVLLAVAAAKEAWEASGIEEFDKTRVGILVGSAIGGIISIVEYLDVLRERGADRISPFFIPSVLPDTASGQIAIQLGITGPNFAPVSACATGSTAVGEGTEMIKRGQADVILAGGTEAAMTPLILGGFCAMRGLVAEEVDPTLASRPFDATRAGFVMGEGACILVLEELERATARGATIYAEVVGYGASNDAHHLAQPEPEATGVAAMMRGALERAGIAPERVGLHQRARDLDTARRSRRDAGDPPGVRRSRLLTRGLVDEVGDGTLLRCRRGDRGDDVRPGALPRRPAADDQLSQPRPGARPRLRPERRARGRGRRRAFERDGPRRPQRLRAARPGVAGGAPWGVPSRAGAAVSRATTAASRGCRARRLPAPAHRRPADSDGSGMRTRASRPRGLP